MKTTTISESIELLTNANMLTDQDEFFAMKKPSIDDTLDEQTIRHILADKRRELELPVR